MDSRKKFVLFPLTLLLPLALVANYWFQFAPGAPRAVGLGRYLGFFTVQTNLLTLAWAGGEWAGALWTRRSSVRTWLLVYLTVTAVVFLVVLLPQQTYPHGWSLAADLVLHPLVWLVVAGDYFVRPPETPPRRTALVLVYPTAYLVLALVLGGLGWYPYDFVDPRRNPYFVATVGGFGLVLMGLAWAAPRLAILVRPRRPS